MRNVSALNWQIACHTSIKPSVSLAYHGEARLQLSIISYCYGSNTWLLESYECLTEIMQFLIQNNVPLHAYICAQYAKQEQTPYAYCITILIYMLLIVILIVLNVLYDIVQDYRFPFTKKV